MLFKTSCPIQRLLFQIAISKNIHLTHAYVFPTWIVRSDNLNKSFGPFLQQPNKAHLSIVVVKNHLSRQFCGQFRADKKLNADANLSKHIPVSKQQQEMKDTKRETEIRLIKTWQCKKKAKLQGRRVEREQEIARYDLDKKNTIARNRPNTKS